jgi:DNA excision repair protein ERCC-2
MNMVLEEFVGDDYEVFIQKSNMSQIERSKLLKSFSEKSDHTKLGFFVLGGSFSEGIDYVGDMLSGVLVVGVAMPMYNPYNELLRSHFDEHFDEGFDYAYTYPGMNKVIQAVGRVIRTKEDMGVAILFDDRYDHRKYKELFPKHWSHYKRLNKNEFIQSALKLFWNQKKQNK